MIISSRQDPAAAPAEIVISITEDYTVDPPELRVIRVTPNQDTLLLIKHPADKISMYDLVNILHKLDVSIEYEELRP